MAFPELAWSSGGELHSRCFSAEEEKFEWDILCFLGECRESRLKLRTTQKKLKSEIFSFAGATWNLFFSIDQEDHYCQFGIYVQTRTDAEFDCNSNISFGSSVDIIKKLKCKLKCESAGSCWRTDNFFSPSELDKFLHDGTKIICRISRKKSSIKQASSQKKINHSTGDSGIEAPTQTLLLKNDSVAFPESTWPRGGELYRDHISPWVIDVTWMIENFLRGWSILKESDKELKSVDFSFGDATFNFFASFDPLSFGNSCQFGINVYTHVPSDKVVFNCSNISFHLLNLGKIKDMKCKIKCVNSNSRWTVSNFLSYSELVNFLRNGCYVTCRIVRQKFGIQEACSKTEIPHSHRSTAVEVHTQTQHPESKVSREKCSLKDACSQTEIFKSKISREKCSLKDACSQTEIPHSSKSTATEAHTQTQESEDCDDADDSIDDEDDSIDDEDDFIDDEDGDSDDETEDSDDETEDSDDETEDSDDDEVNLVVKVSQDFKKLLSSKAGCDVTIQVKGKEFKAHRSVLMARSSVFLAMFQNDMKENATGVVDIDDCDPLSFPALLEFLYCGRTNLSVENVFTLYTSAEKYDQQDLKRKCLKFIKKNISVDTFCETLKLSLLHSETNLLQFAIDFFTKNLKDIIVTVKWQSFIVENPIQANEVFIKAVASDGHKH